MYIYLERFIEKEIEEEKSNCVNEREKKKTFIHDK